MYSVLFYYLKVTAVCCSEIAWSAPSCQLVLTVHQQHGRNSRKNHQEFSLCFCTVSKCRLCLASKDLGFMKYHIIPSLLLRSSWECWERKPYGRRWGDAPKLHLLILLIVLGSSLLILGSHPKKKNSIHIQHLMYSKWFHELADVILMVTLWQGPYSYPVIEKGKTKLEMTQVGGGSSRVWTWAIWLWSTTLFHELLDFMGKLTVGRKFYGGSRRFSVRQQAAFF